jgi:hypothetical protein
VKIGDRVKAVVLDVKDLDDAIKKGYTGTIMNDYFANDGSALDVFEVKFDKEIISRNLNEDGTYDMWRYQLKLLEDDL